MRLPRNRKPKPSSFPADQLIFAQWLKETLRKSRLTGAELSERADVSKAAMYFYLDGSRIPGPAAVQKISAALRIPVESVPAFQRRAVGKPAHKSHAATVTADVR
jgi:transcriptional regulator with XRE-family HTH domain